MTFVFPPDRFPSFSDERIGLAEEFGPPMPFRYDPNEKHARARVVDHPDYQFYPKKKELEAGRMEILYNPVDDEYTRPIAQKTLKGWKNGLYRYLNIEHKMELDWRMAYLARMDADIGPFGNDRDAFIEWRFNLDAASANHAGDAVSYQVKSLQMRAPFKVYRDGKVRVLVCSRDDYTILLDPQQTRIIHRAKGWTDFVIRAELTGHQEDGQYHNCYQNAQLFRRPKDKCRNPEWVNPFKVVIELEPAAKDV